MFLRVSGLSWKGEIDYQCLLCVGVGRGSTCPIYLPFVTEAYRWQKGRERERKTPLRKQAKVEIGMWPTSGRSNDDKRCLPRRYMASGKQAHQRKFFLLVHSRSYLTITRKGQIPLQEQDL